MAGHDPVRSALKYVQAVHGGLDGWNELHR
jgi:hypothetical protein